MSDADEAWLIERLKDRSVSDADHVSCIEMLEALLLTDARKVLDDVTKDNTRSLEVRQRAAQAIRNLDPR